eukprot:4773263-Pleurochrysis_carterae.AAC.2
MPLSFATFMLHARALGLEGIASVTVNGALAVLWREAVSTPWQKCVLLRIASDRFEVWDEIGTERIEEYVYGFDSIGAALEDSIQSEWGLTLELPFFESGKHNLALNTENAQDGKGVIKSLVHNNFACFIARNYSTDPIPPIPVPPAPIPPPAPISP